MNKDTHPVAFLSRTLRSPPTADKQLSADEFVTVLRFKLENLRREQRNKDQLLHHLNLADPSDDSSRLPPLPSKNQINHGQLVADLKRFQSEEDNQSILDQHVSRVWSDLTPHLSPGTISPCPVVPNRRRTHDSITTGGDGKEFSDFQSIDSPNFYSISAGQSMRHSKSMPDHASSSKRLTHKWSSMNTDSGISLFSNDTTLRSRDFK